MTHSWESEFRREVASWLIDNGYHVRSNIYYDETGRFADLVVDTGFVVVAIEVENDFESAFCGVSQAAVYAAEADKEYPDQPVTPLVLVPEGHVEEPERSMIESRAGVPIREWSH